MPKRPFVTTPSVPVIQIKHRIDLTMWPIQLTMEKAAKKEK